MAAVLKSKAFKRICIALGSLLALLAVLIGGLLIWLQTSHAEKFLQDFLTETLAKQGLYLKIDELEGPLPRRIFVRGLELSDRNGVWLKAEEFEARVKLVSLFKWQLNLPILRIEQPQLLRLPDLPPAQQPEQAKAAQTENGAPFTLPIAFRLGALELNGGRIGQKVLAPVLHPEQANGAAQNAPVQVGQLAQPAGATTTPASGAPAAGSDPQRSADLAGVAGTEEGLPTMSLELDANGTVSNSGIALNLEASLLHPDGSGFAVTLLTGHKDTFNRNFLRELQERGADSQVGGETTYWPLGLSAEDRMYLSVSARENGGLAQALSGMKDFPAYDLQLRGFGAPQDWRAKIFAVAGTASGAVPQHPSGLDGSERSLDRNFVAADSRLGYLEGALGIASENRNIAFDSILDTRLGAELKLTARPGGLSPQQLRALLAPELALELKAQLNRKQPTVESALAETENWRLTLSDLDVYSNPDRGTILNGNLAAQLKKASFLAALQPGTPQDAYDFIENAAIDTRVHFETGGPAVQARLDGKGESRIGGENLSLDYLLDASYTRDPEKGNIASLKELRLNALGVSALASGTLDMQSGKLELEANMNAAAGGAWHPLLSRLTAPGTGDVAASPIPNGQLALRIKAESNELLPPSSTGTDAAAAIPNTLASLDFEGSGMSWPEGLMSDLLTGACNLEARLEGSGAGNGSYRLNLQTLEAGLIKGSGEATLSGAGGLAELTSLNPERASLESVLNLEIESLAPLLSAAGMSEAVPVPDADPAPDTITSERAGAAAGSVVANSGSTLAAAQQGEILPVPVAGRAVADHGGKLVLSANGLLSNLDLEADLGLAELRSPGNVPMRDIRGRVRGLLQLNKAPNATGQSLPMRSNGTLAFSFGLGSAGLFRLDSDWMFDLEEGRAAVSHLLAKARGLQLSADMDVDFAPPSGAPAHAANGPSINGQARLDIQEWRTIAGLSGVRLGGDPASLELTLTPEPAGQKLDANWQTGHIYIYESDPEGHGVRQTVFSLNSTSGIVSVEDLLKLPVINLNASTGIGRAGRLAWSSGEAKVESDHEEGRFKVALYGWQRRSGASGPSGRASSGASGGSSSSTRAGADNSSSARSADSGAARNASSGTARPRGRERLALAGSFKLAVPSVTLDDFIFRSNDDATNVSLASPVTVDLSRGVLVPDLNLAMKPSGSVKASAEIAGNDMQVKLEASTVSMQVASLFTDALLPKGYLNADLDLIKKGGELTGRAVAEAVLTPTETSLQTQGSAPDVPDSEKIDQMQESVSAQQEAAGQQEEAGAQTQENPFTFRLAANFSRAPSGKFAAVRQQAGLTYLSGEGSIHYAGANADSKAAELSFDFPLQANGAGFPSPSLTRPLGLRLAWQGHTAPLWGLVPLADREFRGYGQIDLSVGGTLTLPEYDGHIYLLNGRYEDKILGVLLENIRLEGRGSNRDLNLVLSLEDGQNGSVKVEGAIQAPRQRTVSAQGVVAAEPPHLSVRGQINHLRPLRRDDLDVQISGILGANGPISSPALSANLELEYGQFTLLSSLGGGIRTLDIELPDEEQNQEPAAGMPLDVTLNIPNRFYIRGYGLDSEWAGNVSVKGDSSLPLVTGEVHPVRGYFELLSKPFAFSEEGGIYLDGQEKINPRLDLSLTYTGPSLTAIINILGTANRPQLDLTSNPVLPKDQILSEVLFGKSFSSLSRFEAIQVANGLRQLSGGGGFDLFGSLRQGFGLDMLRIGSGESTGQQQRNTYGTLGASDLGGGSSGSGDDESMPTLEAGKYINDAIYVGVEQGVTENSTGVRVEVELRHNLTLEGRSNVQSSEVGVGWKKDY